ncbi:MAG TPA: hypothetical protein VK821_09055 [Dehalococcoidia bacterium]|nr:hypothetical protein [Dehalococcoidia bacterium]
MPQYVGIGKHDPSECPGANGKMREVWKKVTAGAPAMHEKHGVKLVLGPLHLDPSHSILAVMEAPNQDAVQDFLIESRLGQIQSMELYRGTDLMALFAQGDASMPPLY